MTRAARMGTPLAAATWFGLARVQHSTDGQDGDEVARPPGLALVGGGGALAAAVRGACRDLNISLGALPLVGAQFDHLPFADVGLDAATLVTAGWAALSVHTGREVASHRECEGFRRAGAVALKVLERFSA